jgi:hypothetical protein
LSFGIDNPDLAVYGLGDFMGAQERPLLVAIPASHTDEGLNEDIFLPFGLRARGASIVRSQGIAPMQRWTGYSD